MPSSRTDPEDNGSQSSSSSSQNRRSTSNSATDSSSSSSIFTISKKAEIVLFSSTAIALYGYDQGMMSLINTNYSYLRTMGIAETSPLVGIIVSVYYLGCTAGAVLASALADIKGRKPAIFGCLATCVIGNLLMFVAGLNPAALLSGQGEGGGEGHAGWGEGKEGLAMACMLLGRVILGLGVGGIDAVIPVYSAELSKDEARGKALAQEFQMNIFGLLLAFAINLLATLRLGKENQWAWRTPILCMQVFPALLLSFISRLPESPRWFVSQDRKEEAKESLLGLNNGSQLKAGDLLAELTSAQEDEGGSGKIGYKDMLLPDGDQFHPTMLTVMGQVNQALTGYGAVSVYGPQIFELLGFGVRSAEWMTLGNFVSYFAMMTVAWMTIDVLGRRKLMVWGAGGLAGCFLLLALFGGLAMDFPTYLPEGGAITLEVLGSIALFVATAIFGICWLATVWLIPTEIYPSGARAQGSAVSVIVWGIANFTITLMTPIMFNNLKYWLFLVFAATNTFAGWWTWKYSPETGGRSFEDNQEFFVAAREDDEGQGSWVVHKIDDGKFLRFPKANSERDEEGGNKNGDGEGERQPLLRSS